MKIKIKSIIALILLFVFIVCGSYGCYTQADQGTIDIRSIDSYIDIPGITEEEIAAIENIKSERQNLSFGNLILTEAFILPDGTYAGFFTLLCELLENLFGIPVVQEFHTWDVLLNGVDGLTIDFMGDLTPTPERMLEYYMTHPIAERSLAIFVNEDFGDIETAENTNGLKIGFLEGAITSQTLLEAYPDLEFEIIRVQHEYEAASALKAGTIDAYITETVDAASFEAFTYIKHKEIFPLVYNPVSLSTANPYLAPIISAFDKYIIAGGVDVLHDLYMEGNNQYLQYGLNKSFTDEEKTYLKNLAKNDLNIKVALEHDSYPLCFYDKKSNEFSGIVPDVLREISALTGIVFEVATDRNTSWQEIIDMLSSDQVSFVSELIPSDEWEGKFLWPAEPYFTSRYALLSKSDYPDLEVYQLVRSTVGSVKGTVYVEVYNNWFYENPLDKLYNTQNEALDALEKDEIDLLMTSEYILLAQMNYREKTGYKVNIVFPSQVGSYFGFNKDERLLCSIVSKAQEYVDTEKIAKNWTGRVYDYSRKFAAERLVYMSLSSAALLFVLIILIVLYVKNSRMKENYKRQMTTLSTLYKSVPALLYSKDLNGRYTSCNAAFEEYAGFSEAEIIGQTTAELFVGLKDAPDIYMENDKSILETHSVTRTEESLVYPDRSVKLCETVKAPLVQDGKMIGFLGVMTDISRYKEAEEAAQEASKAKSSFLAHMSHEIRTPMNTIMGMNELILQEDLTDKVAEYAMLVRQASSNMLILINDLLDFSKIEAGKLEIAVREYSFASLINDIISIINTRVFEKPILFVANIDCNIPRDLIGDDTRIRQVLINILSNAVKYTEEGYIALTASCAIEGDTAVLKIEVKDSGIGIKEESIDTLFDSFARFDLQKNQTIEGTGLGLAITQRLCEAMNGNISVESEYGAGSLFTVTIPQQFNEYEKLAEVIDRENKSILLYEPRSVYADSIARTFENLGVRCSRVTSRKSFYDALIEDEYEFVFMPCFIFDTENQLEKLKTSIKPVLIKDLEEVSFFKGVRTITMPVCSFVIADVLNDSTVGMEGYFGNSVDQSTFIAPSAKVLVVDDIGTNLMVAKGLMSKYKMQIDTCKAGVEAIRLASVNRYDIIFMDQTMPEMDGIAAVGAIRSLEDDDGYYKSVPIVALTANAVTGMKEIFLQNGFSDFLPKPIDVTKLNYILKNWIPARKHETSNESSKGAEEEGCIMEIEGVDVTSGLALNGNSMENYLRTLKVFTFDVEEKMSELRTCLNENNIRLYTTLVHGLKSASANIGAKKISDFARTLEQAGKSEAILFITEHNDELMMQLEKLLSNIEKATSLDSKPRDAGANDINLLKKSLANLKTALENMDAGQINNIINELESRQWEKKNEDIISELSQFVLLFDYNEAIALIDDSLNSLL